MYLHGHAIEIDEKVIFMRGTHVVYINFNCYVCKFKVDFLFLVYIHFFKLCLLEISISDSMLKSNFSIKQLSVCVCAGLGVTFHDHDSISLLIFSFSLMHFYEFIEKTMRFLSQYSECIGVPW